MNAKFTNHLIKETSPYLLQHAHNPVNWFAWTEEALSKAKSENKLILISIGYSACHWCHVMEKESFENENVAKIMNENFINIKIDREERPDLDHIYMDAVQAISGGGGWPLNVFLTPDAKPFFGGTYFPPLEALNRPSWTDVLKSISMTWSQRKRDILSQAENLTDHLLKANKFEQAIITFPPENLSNFDLKQKCEIMFIAVMKTADRVWGGFGRSPKFPQTFIIQYLFQYHYFTGNAEALTHALLSIDKMLMGGIYDHIGGGFARYSTDDEWLVPHFEKMLYDNALLLNVLCEAFQLTSKKCYKDAIHKIISFVKRDLAHVEGGFYSALDADSEGEEGKYYTWDKAEIDEILKDDSAFFCNFYDITEEGNWEGKNIIRIDKNAKGLFQGIAYNSEEFSFKIDQCLEKLLIKRNKRIPPSLDDKILLGWNALLIKAIAKAALALDSIEYSKIAETSFYFLEAKFRVNNSSYSLLHTYKNDEAKYPAFLDDYACVISCCLQLYKLNYNLTFLKKAYEYCNYVIKNFSDEEAVFFYFTNISQSDVIIRKKEIYDGALPSGNSIMAENLYLLSTIFNKEEWKIRADSMLKIMHFNIFKYPGTFAIWASLTLQQVYGITEVAVIGRDFNKDARKILLKYRPNLIIMGSKKSNPNFVLLKGKPYYDGSQFFICKNYSCFEPVFDIGNAFDKIDELNKICR